MINHRPLTEGPGMDTQYAEIERLKAEIQKLKDKNALEQSKLEFMFDQSHTGMALLKGSDFIFEKVNSRWEELVSKRPYLGRSFGEVYSDLTARELENRLMDVYLTGNGYRVEGYFITATTDQGPEDRYYDISYVRILDRDEKPFGIYAQAQEVTEKVVARRKLETAKQRLEDEFTRSDQQRSKFEAAFETVDEGVFIFDSLGNPVFMNNGAAKVFGAQSAQDVTQRFEFYFERLDLYELDGSFIPLSEWPVAKVLRGENFRDWQIKAHRTDTDDRWIWSSSGALVTQKGSDITLAVVVLRDITEQKAAEDELRLAKLTAENANLAKTAFIANMSHEIRTPIGVILGFCELLLNNRSTEAERTNYLTRVVKNAKGLTRIIDDILDMAKVEAGKLEVEEVKFSFNHLLQEVVELFSDRAQEKGIYLKAHADKLCPSFILSDPTRIRQILINIVGNAIKFTSHGGVDIHVQCKLLSEHRHLFQIQVIDSGIGLSETMQQQIFQPFVQANSNTNRIFGGTGLGLVISRRLAMALGGNILIEESEEGKGSSFLISFQAGAVASKTTKSLKSKDLVADSKDLVAADLGRLSGLHILLADDSPDNQLLIKRILIKHGASVELANNGQEAIDLAQHLSFDIVLMDVQMPVVDGYQATRKLRTIGFEKPILALTAHAMTEERQRSKDAGCNAHLTKPVNTVELVESILRFTQ
jgi:signal transduction histidine kinase/CheY-like chemotaxis protein